MLANRALFVQATEPAAYPPLISASQMLAEAGWQVTVLAAPYAEMNLVMPSNPNITVISMPVRSTHIMSPWDYANYCWYALRLARGIQPGLVYASDPLGALPGLLAAKAVGGKLVYHEHDSPNQQADLNQSVRVARYLTSRLANWIIFPNAERAAIAAGEIGFLPDRVRIVWNLPRLSELPRLPESKPGRFIVYYHGSIAPDKVPRTIFEAASRLQGSAHVRIAGYETASGSGYIARLVREFGDIEHGGIVEYVGQVARSALLTAAADTHVGLALIPSGTNNVNLVHMTGASNKPFDYMAAGLPLIVSDLPDWKRMFVEPRYALAADACSVDSIEEAFRRFFEDPALRAEMSARNRARIAEDWNYDTAFRPMVNEFAET